MTARRVGRAAEAATRIELAAARAWLVALTFAVVGGSSACATAADQGSSEAPRQAVELSLIDAVARGQQSVDVRRSRAVLREREAAAHRARADLLVDVEALATYARRRDLPPTPAYDDRYGRLTASQPLIDVAGWRRLAAARGEERAAQYQHEVARERAAAAVAKAYLRVARADLDVAARVADLDLARQLAREADAQVEAGLGDRLSGTRAHGRAAAADGDRIAAQQEREQARIALARAMEDDAQADVAIATPLTDAFADLSLSEDASALANRAASTRAEVRAAVELADAARSSLGAATAAYAPRAGLEADVGRRDTDSIGMPPGYAAVWSASVTVSIPVPLNGAIAADREAAAGRLAEAALTLEDVRRSVDAEVRDACAALVAGRARLGAAQERLRLADDEIAQARVRFETGTGDHLALDQAQLALGQARDAVIEARATIAGARIDLARAVGCAAALR